MAEHTPTPWETAAVWGRDTDKERTFVRRKGDAASSWILNTMSKNAAAPTDAVANANAEFIVRAVNAHDDLLAACQQAEVWLNKFCACTGADDPVISLREAIAKARPSPD